MPVREDKQSDLSFELCVGARLLHHWGLSVGIAGHVSAMLDREHMLVNRYGASFGTLLPEDLLVLDLAGNIVSGRGRTNDTIRLHTDIHRAHPNLVAVAHAHPPEVVTYSVFRIVPPIFDQDSAQLAGDVGIVDEEYSGLAQTEARLAPTVDALRTYRAVILPNHGAITTGESIQSAIIAMGLLNAMVRRHLEVMRAARALGLEPMPISADVVGVAKRELKALGSLGLAWEDMKRRLRKSDPELFAGRSTQ